MKIVAEKFLINALQLALPKHYSSCRVRRNTDPKNHVLQTPTDTLQLTIIIEQHLNHNNLQLSRREKAPWAGPRSEPTSRGGNWMCWYMQFTPASMDLDRCRDVYTGY